MGNEKLGQGILCPSTNTNMIRILKEKLKPDTKFTFDDAMDYLYDAAENELTKTMISDAKKRASVEDKEDFMKWFDPDKIDEADLAEYVKFLETRSPKYFFPSLDMEWTNYRDKVWDSN